MKTVSKLEAATVASIAPPVLPDNTQVVQSAGWYQFINPNIKDAFANEIVLSQIKDSEIEERVRQTIGTYRSLEIPFKWAIGPMSSPARLENIVAKSASISWEFRGMAINTSGKITYTDGLEIERVSSKNFIDFLDVNLDGWALRPYKKETRSRLEKMASHPQYRCFLVRKDGRAIGTASTVLKEGYGYLIGAVILEKFRGLGAYRALVNARISDLHNLRVPFAVTQARALTSAPILTKLGFETVYEAKMYRFDVSS